MIHSWWVPALGWKKDTIPGFINEAWTAIDQPGTYRGQCAELCGRDHAFMPIVVIAKSPSDYSAWVEEQKGSAVSAAADAQREWTKDELIVKGEEVYKANCMACHLPNGVGVPPAFPSLVNSPLVSGDVSAHIDMVLNGKPGTAMAAYKSILNDVDLAAVITYERNAWGNDFGAAQPADIKARR